MNPVNTVFDAKRLIGRKYSDASVQSDIKLWPFKVKSGPAEKPMIEVDYRGETKEFAAEEISSMVLIKMCASQGLSWYIVCVEVYAYRASALALTPRACARRKEVAEAFLGKIIKNAVVTVPGKCTQHLNPV